MWSCGGVDSFCEGFLYFFYFVISCFVFFFHVMFFLFFMLCLNFSVSFDTFVLSFDFNFQHQCFVSDNQLPHAFQLSSHEKTRSTPLLGLGLGWCVRVPRMGPRAGSPGRFVE